MSSHPPYGSDNRIDSFVDLHTSLGPHLVRNGTMDSSECSTAGTSLTTLSGPWSQFNPDCARVNDNSAIDHRSPIIDPRICLSPTRYLVSTSRSPSPEHSSPHPQVIACGQCGIKFTGHWRRSNLLRHVRHKHGGTKVYACEVEGCDKIFKRGDAKLKHMRTHHDHCSLQATMKQKARSVADADFEVGQWLSTSTPLSATTDASSDGTLGLLQNEIGSTAEDEASRHAARMVFVALREKMGERRFAHELPGLLNLWEATAQRLYNLNSETYPLYRQIFDDLRTIATTINRARGESYKPRGSRGSSSIASGVGSACNQSDRVKKCSKKGGYVGSGSSSSVRTAEDTIKQDKSGAIGCPWYQRWDQLGGRQRGDARPCSGCTVTFMSEVRSHFDPRRVGTHRNLLPNRYYQHCKVCKKDFIEERTYQAHICSPLSISHHDIESQWIPLCLTLFSIDEDIPSPYVGASTPLDRAVVARYRLHNLGSITSAEAPFLGGGLPQSGSQTGQQTSPFGDVPPSLYVNGMGFVLQSAVSLATPPADRVHSSSQSYRTQQDRSSVSTSRTTHIFHLQHIRELSQRIHNTASRVQVAQYGTSDIDALVTDAQAVYNTALHVRQHYQDSGLYQSQPSGFFSTHPSQFFNAPPAPQTPPYLHDSAGMDLYRQHNRDHGGTQQEALDSNAYSGIANQQPISPSFHTRDNSAFDARSQEIFDNTLAPYILSPAASNIPYSDVDMGTTNSSQGHYANSSTNHPSTSTGVTSNYDIIDPILQFIPNRETAESSYALSCFPCAPSEEASSSDTHEYHDMQASWQGFQA